MNTRRLPAWLLLVIFSALALPAAASSTRAPGLRHGLGASVRARPAPVETVKDSKKKKPQNERPSKKKAAGDGESNALWDMLVTINGYYPILLDENLEPEVEEQVVPMWIAGVFCGEFCGALWIPMVLVGEWPGKEYFIFAALSYLLQQVLLVMGVPTSTFLGIGAIWSTFVLLYLTPVGIIDDYDRALKKERAKGTERLRSKGKHALLAPAAALPVLY